MASEAAIEALRRHRARESQRKKTDVLVALEEMRLKGDRLTITGVAAAAGVSREFIHSHIELHSAVSAAAADLGRRGQEAGQLLRQGGTDAGRRADKATLLARVERDKVVIAQLREKIADFQADRRRRIGSKLDLSETVGAVAIEELRSAHERLRTDAHDLARRLAESQGSVEDLRSNLEASQQAHLEDVQRLSAHRENVVPFARPSRQDDS